MSRYAGVQHSVLVWANLARTPQGVQVLCGHLVLKRRLAEMEHGS